MSFDILASASVSGPAFPEPFVRFELGNELVRLRLLPKNTGEEGRELQVSWEAYRSKIRDLVSQGGAVRVRNHVIEPLVSRLGYEHLEEAGVVETREGREPGGYFLTARDGSRLRAWAVSLGEDLDAPSRRGRAYRFSHARVANRVLLAAREQIGLLTNGYELRIILSDPSRPDSNISIPVDPHWKQSREVPDTFRMLSALARPAGVKAIPDLVEKARLQQSAVTKDLRIQARKAVEEFVQEILNHPSNSEALVRISDKEKLAKYLWHEGLTVVYRLLFILKLEANDDPARCFNFASASLWRNTFSPSVALARYTRAVLETHSETGSFLEDGLRALFRMFGQGFQSNEIQVHPLNGALFGPNTMPLLDSLRWGDRAVAFLLDRLLWTPAKRGADSRKRVHYGSLDVENLGSVYEALLELEPGVASETMCRLRRKKLEVVVPIGQGEKYKTKKMDRDDNPTGGSNEREEEDDEGKDVDGSLEKSTGVEWIEKIPAGRFFLQVGLGRKATGSFYTPTPFVKFLVQETLGPLVSEKSPPRDPNPLEILKIKVLDPAMGSGHFLVEACRFLGDHLYEACRLCDERSYSAEGRAEGAKSNEERARYLSEAKLYKKRVLDLPDPHDEILAYLPSRATEGGETGLSQKKAEALCRRLVSIHCLYGVDKNPLAVELAKLSLWLESHAEKLPLTFLDHRLIVGDSLTGPFYWNVIVYPGSKTPLDDLFSIGLREKLVTALEVALEKVHSLQSTVGIDLAEVEAKVATKNEIENTLAPFKVIAAAWSGGAMLAPSSCDDAGYAKLIRHVVESNGLPAGRLPAGNLSLMIGKGLGLDVVPLMWEDIQKLVVSGKINSSLPYDLAFPDVFFKKGRVEEPEGFDVVLGNPPWDKLKNEKKSFAGSFYFPILEIDRKSQWEPVADEVLSKNPIAAARWEAIVAQNAAMRTIGPYLYRSQAYTIGDVSASGDRDLFIYFSERGVTLLKKGGQIGFVLSGGLAKNPAATNTRKLLFEESELRYFRHFHNRRTLFADLPEIVEFTLVVATKQPWTPSSKCSIGLDLDEFDHLHHRESDTRFRSLTLDELRREAGELLILTGEKRTAFPVGSSLGAWLMSKGINLGNDLHRTMDEGAYRELKDVLPGATDGRDPSVTRALWGLGYAPLRSGRSIGQFTDLPETKSAHWDTRVSIVVLISEGRAPAKARYAQYYRLALRRSCGSPKSNERSLIACILPPGNIGPDQIFVEQDTSARPTYCALLSCAVLNSYTPDSLIRPFVQAVMTKSFLESIGSPNLSVNMETFLVHSSLRLTCNHVGFKALWHEQVGEAWREGTSKYSWPVLFSMEQRWSLRAQIDAVVAVAYGLSREQYIGVLSKFTHRSFPNASETCLAAYDVIQSIGLDEFLKRHDPYQDISLNRENAKPAISIHALPSSGMAALFAGTPDPPLTSTPARWKGRPKAKTE